MNTVVSAKMKNPRLSTKLITLFCLVFFGLIAGGLTWDIFANMIDSQNNRAQIENQPTTIIIDPKLETELAKVMAIENSQITADLKDPFLDRSGISLSKNLPIGSSVKPSTTVASSTSSQNVAATPTTNQQGGTVTSPSGSTTTNPVIEVKKEKEDSLTRMLRRDERIRLGLPVRPESEVFDIEDLLPVGVVSGGNGQDEILLYSQSADRTYSYPVGTKFHDGWLSGIRNEGGVFSFYQTKEVRLKSWVRSIQPRTSSGLGSLNQPGTPGGN